MGCVKKTMSPEWHTTHMSGVQTTQHAGGWALQSPDIPDSNSTLGARLPDQPPQIGAALQQSPRNLNEQPQRPNGRTRS